ncbi:hypothetical protein FQZ97_1079590 [compost metagenome]
MFDGGEGRGHFPADLLRRRIVRDQLRVERFKLLKPAEQSVELGIGDEGLVLLVVGEPVLPDEVHQVLVLVAHRLGRNRFRLELVGSGCCHVCGT